VWSYVLMAAVGVLGLMALTLAFLSLHTKRQIKTNVAPPLVYTPPCAFHKISHNTSRGTFLQRIMPNHRCILAQDAGFLFHIAQFIDTVSSLDGALEHVMKELMKHLGVDMGQVFLLDDEEMLQLAISVGSFKQQNSLPNWEFTLPSLVLAADKPLIIPDLHRWPQLQAFISATELASMFWLPLKTGGRTVGALGLGSRRLDAFDQGAVTMVTMVASYLATAVESLRLRRQVTQERELRQTIQRYVSPRLVATFQQESAPHPQEVIDASGRMSVLFADVRSFTPLMEKADPNAVMQVLNEYFLRMSQIIQAHGGVVDEFAGDQIVASFDRTSPRVNDACRAVQAGVEMLASLKTLQKRWRERGLPTFDIGIGISTGAVTRGSIGSKDRKALIALGSILNIASRAEGMNKKFGTHLLPGGSPTSGYQ